MLKWDRSCLLTVLYFYINTAATHHMRDIFNDRDVEGGADPPGASDC